MNKCIVMDGKRIKKEILEALRKKVSELSLKPTFVVIQVGNDSASNIYIKNKQKMAEFVGYNCIHIKLPENVKENYILKKIDELNADDNIHGIMVQMPLPDNLNSDKILNRIHAIKDIDGLTDINSGLMFHKKNALYSCTPEGILELLKRYNISVEGKNIVVVGRSNLVGKPLSMLFLNNSATVTICHSKTKKIEKCTKKADILVSCCGIANYIKKNMIKKGAVVIDVGINKIGNKICGDVDFENVQKKASYITPVPGGVGQMTVAMLGSNILKAYNMQKGSNNVV